VGKRSKCGTAGSGPDRNATPDNGKQTCTSSLSNPVSENIRASFHIGDRTVLGAMLFISTAKVIQDIYSRADRHVSTQQVL
jgi:hypothetical protein